MKNCMDFRACLSLANNRNCWVEKMIADVKYWIRMGMILAVISVPASHAAASDFYVAQNTTGSGSGSDSSDCQSLAWVNSTYAWTAGDTIHLVGTLTNNLTVGGSGSAGNPITIYFEPNAKFSAPTFPSSTHWIDVGSYSWITIDGGSNGLIENTSNGTVAANGGTMTYGNDGAGISVATAGHLTIRNLAIRNMYQRQTNSETIQGTGDGNDIFLGGGSDIVVSNCVLGEALNTLTLTYSTTLTSNLTVTATILTNFNHGLTLGSGGSPTPLFDNVLIFSNKFLGGDNV